MEKIKMFGADWCSDCRRAKQYLNEQNIEFDFVNIDVDQDAVKLVETINNGKRIIPTLVINGKSYTNPNNAKLASVLGINENHQITLFGADWCPDCLRAKQFLSTHEINYQFIDVDQNPWATKKVEEINNGKRIIPTLLINGKPYTNPKNAELIEILSINKEKEDTIYDVIIVGAGAAGLTASIYAQRDRFNSLILEKSVVGGNAFLTEKIENYPGFQSISGPKLMSKMEEQATTYGATIKTGVTVSDIKKNNDLFTIETDFGTYIGKSVILSTGSTYKKLNIPGEKELIGAGIHFCATCDGAFYKDKDIVVVGGGNTALEESIFLSKFVKSIKLIHRGKEFSASQTYIDKLDSVENIQVFLNSESKEFLSNKENTFQGVRIKNKVTDEEETLVADGAFIFVGQKPNTKNFENIVDLNERGFIKTNGLAQTSVKGIFAAGDCREGAIAQVSAATGEGVLASYGIKEYLKQ
jgi:thioredoxin reductase (NADPH)